MNTLTTIAPESASESAFKLAQRKAMALSQSSLVPESYRGEKNMPNVLIALEVAQRIGATPLQVMQSLHVIQGRPSWSSSFLIATVNACGRFTPIRFEVVGTDPAAEDYRVRAFAEDKATGERCNGPWVNWAMVKAEGWLKKTGSKWATMPELMFLYRAAGFWTRVYAPELSMGLQTQEEAEDVSALHGHGVTQAASSPELLQTIEQELIGEELPRVPVGPDFTAQEVHDAIVNAKDADSLDLAGDLVNMLPVGERGDLTDLYSKRLDEIKA